MKFYAHLERSFPGLKERYIRTYGAAYECTSPNVRQLEQVFREECDRRGIWRDNQKIFAWLSALEDKMEQLTMF